MFSQVAVATVLLIASGTALAQSHDGAAIERADANKDGKVTRQEYVEARSAQFAFMDRNADGVVDDADSRERANQSAMGKRMAHAMRGRIDANGDGKITRDEYLDAPTTLFERFDGDKNGELDAKELAAAQGAAERLRERRRQ